VDPVKAMISTDKSVCATSLPSYGMSLCSEPGLKRHEYLIHNLVSLWHEYLRFITWLDVAQTLLSVLSEK